jgi:TolB-like protein/DNA-binding winged helix-turn-helix (wHTH) protein/Flp pilus assembly protein TadD
MAPKVFSTGRPLKTMMFEVWIGQIFRGPETVIGLPRLIAFHMSSTAPVVSVLRFDIFELDVRAGELRKHGVKMRLQGQPLQVLEILLKRASDVVTREEIRAELWKVDTFVDFDHSLHNAIARIREVLGDSAERPRYIETLPRRGYRFIGAVEDLPTPTPRLVPEASNGATPTVAEGTSTTKRNQSLVLVSCAFFVLGIAVWAVWHRAYGTAVIPPIGSIAVLPLDNFSGDPSQDYFVDGMTDELITDLAKVGALQVVSRTSVMRYKGTKKSLPEIARELNVEGIIEGSVTRSGQRVRITAQLLHGPTDKHLWAETYDRDVGDVLKLQSEVAQTIAQQVRAKLTPQQQALLSSVRPVNPQAYDAYVKGRYYFTNDFSNTEKLKLAKSYFEESIRKDPDFALAYSGLADSYTYLALYGAGDMQPSVAYKSAKEALHKALDLDGSIGEAYDTLGTLNWRFQWDWNEAERDFQRSIALAPSYSCAREDHALFLAFTGRRVEALAELTKSKELDPGPGSTMLAAGVYYQLRDYEALVDASRGGVVSNPKEWIEHYDLGVGYEGIGKALEAVSEYQKAVELSEGNLDAMASLAHAFAVIGRKTEAKKILTDLEKRSQSEHVSPYYIATIYAGLGEKDKAFEFLERAFQERSLELSWHIKADLRMDNLRSDARFEALLRTVGLVR